MKKVLKYLFLKLGPIIDVVVAIAATPAALILLLYRRVGSRRLPKTTTLLKRIGIFPIRNHYYEPLFDDQLLSDSLDKPRPLVGIDFNVPGQMDLLGQLTYADEFSDFVEQEKKLASKNSFRLKNAAFEAGNPQKIIEVGSGSSTKIARSALSRNAKEGGPKRSHICIEPYEQPWLESFDDIELVRSRIEDCEIDWRSSLASGDLLFIDSSHMIRPQGDVLHEYLNIIPQLRSGVIVHVHDIFSPRDYLDNWIRRDVRFWNEQYLLEATLGNSARYEVIAALNLLNHDYYPELKRVCPYLEPGREPGSFYFRVR